MNEKRNELSLRLAALRTHFDSGFANPPVLPPGDSQSFLEIRVAGASMALRTNEIQGIERHRIRTVLPAQLPAFLGVSGIKGRLLPVFSLESLLDPGSKSRGEEPWVVICNLHEPLALAFDSLERFFTAPASSRVNSAESRRHVRELLRLDRGLLPVLQLSSILAEVARGQPKE